MRLCAGRAETPWTLRQVHVTCRQRFGYSLMVPSITVTVLPPIQIWSPS